MSNQILIYDNYLTDIECDDIYKIFKNTESPIGHNDSIWTNRVKRPTYTEYYNNKLNIERTKICEDFFNKKFKIENLNLTIWKEGHEMPPHSDYGAKNEFPKREYASLIYLNDNYVGGELYIPKLNFELKPKKGQLICFQGGKYLHGVRKIISGERLTSICWFQVL